MSQSLPVCPGEEAARLRSKAEGLSGAEREYSLWLAREWEKAGNRFASQDNRPQDQSLGRRAR